MQIVLVSVHPYPSPQAVPLAAATLKASLSADSSLAEHVSVTLHESFLDQPLAEVVADISRLKADAVGFSMYVWNRARCLEVAAALHSINPNITLFAGGPEATADPGRILNESDLDFIIIGEGETTFVEVVQRLVQGVPISGLAGIAQMDKGAFLCTPRQPACDFNRLPSPYLSGTLDPGEGILWELSRGCSFACDFCFDHKGGSGVRVKSLETIDEELRFFARRAVAQVFVLDSTFNQDLKRAKTILRRIGKIAPHIHFHFEVRSEFIDTELAELFAGITCSLQIGLQSADPGVLRTVGRIFNPADFQGRIDMLNNAGAIFGFDLIYGLPGDSLTGFRNSLDFALSLYPNHLDIFPLAVLPGTRLAERAESLGLEWNRSAPYTVQASSTCSASDLHQAGRLASACDIFYSRGKAVAWFNSVLRSLHLKPATLLAEFAKWLDRRDDSPVNEGELTDRQIHLLQREFLQQLFTGKNRPRLAALAHDLVDYHYYYAQALLAPGHELPTDRDLEHTDLLQVPLVLSDSAFLARFNYEIIDILEAGEVDLREFAGCFKPSGSYAVIYPRANEIFTESLIEPYYRLLHGLQNERTAAGLLDDTGLPPEEAASFLEFAAAEGIVTIRSNTGHP